MPSRVTTGLILCFWLATTGIIFHRDLWPRLVANAPPPWRIDLVDEATSRVPVRWIIYRGNEKLGSLTTELRYVESDDTFWFDNTYRELKFHFDSITVSIPEAETGIRVNRLGDLREQTLRGSLEIRLRHGEIPITLARAKAEIGGVVRDGWLYSQCRITSSLAAPLDRNLEPVSVPNRQVLNPMMPVSRLHDIRPGQRWVIRRVDPLGQALSAAMADLSKQHSPLGSVSGSFGTRTNPELVATVRSAPEPLQRRNGQTILCWVIDYRSGPNDAEATTWVSVEGTRVLRQEASWLGESLRFERVD